MDDVRARDPLDELFDPTNPRFAGTIRPYSRQDVERLRGRVLVEHTLARMGAERLWTSLQEMSYVHALGALTGNQAIQQVRAGLPAIYVSGWQVAADANLAGEMYPDQSIYPANSVPEVVRKINSALMRADQIDHSEGKTGIEWLAPIVADAEAGFGGPHNVLELMKAMIRAGAAGVHFEDQLASEKKCGHMGGKVLVPTMQFVKTLDVARFAADLMGVPTILIGRTDAERATFLTSDADPYDKEFLTGERSPDGMYFKVHNGTDLCIHRGLAYAPHCDLLWMETDKPDLDVARRFAEAIHAKYPGKPLAYNCSPSFKWRKFLDDTTIAKFQRELGSMGYKFQFITLAGFHSLNEGMYRLARRYHESDMTAFVELQDRSFELAESDGYGAVAHQHEVGTGYFDAIAELFGSNTLAMHGSTEREHGIGGH